MLTLKPLVTATLLVLGLGWGLSAVSAQDDEPTPLEAAMGTLQGGMKKLRPLLENPTENQEVLVTSLHEMQAAALAAIAHPPAPPEGFPEGGEFTWRISFQREMLKLADSLFECENGVFRGSAEEAQEAYAKAGALKKAGHDRFK